MASTPSECNTNISSCEATMEIKLRILCNRITVTVTQLCTFCKQRLNGIQLVNQTSYETTYYGKRYVIDVKHCKLSHDSCNRPSKTVTQTIHLPIVLVNTAQS